MKKEERNGKSKAVYENEQITIKDLFGKSDFFVLILSIIQVCYLSFFRNQLIWLWLIILLGIPIFLLFYDIYQEKERLKSRDWKSVIPIGLNFTKIATATGLFVVLAFWFYFPVIFGEHEEHIQSELVVVKTQLSLVIVYLIFTFLYWSLRKGSKEQNQISVENSIKHLIKCSFLTKLDDIQRYTTTYFLICFLFFFGTFLLVLTNADHLKDFSAFSISFKTVTNRNEFWEIPIFNFDAWIFIYKHNFFAQLFFAFWLILLFIIPIMISIRPIKVNEGSMSIKITKKTSLIILSSLIIAIVTIFGVFPHFFSSSLRFSVPPNVNWQNYISYEQLQIATLDAQWGAWINASWLYLIFWFVCFLPWFIWRSKYFLTWKNLMNAPFSSQLSLNHFQFQNENLHKFIDQSDSNSRYLIMRRELRKDLEALEIMFVARGVRIFSLEALLDFYIEDNWVQIKNLVTRLSLSTPVTKCDSLVR